MNKTTGELADRLVQAVRRNQEWERLERLKEETQCNQRKDII